MEKIDSKLTFTWGIIKLLYGVKNNDIDNEKFTKIYEKFCKAKVQKFQSLEIFKACEVGLYFESKF